MASRTGWQIGGRGGDHAQHSAERGLLLQRLGDLAVALLELRCAQLLEQRAFSMAMTAWSANVSSSAICAR